MSQPTSFRLALAASAALLVCACGGSDSSDPPPPPPPPFVHLETGQAAAVVIGQANFTSGLANRGGPVGATTLSEPKGNPAVVDGRLYLPDSINNRVLGFDAIPTANGASADFVLGQTSMSGSASGLSATALNGPFTVTSYAGKMALVDANNDRVLLWSTVPTTTGVPADVVVGKSSFTSMEATCDDRTLTSSEDGIGAIIAGGKLIVADERHHRVLVWNAVPTSNYQPADLVLGQPNFTTCTANTGGLSASSMNYPTGVWSDGTRLLVADEWNTRVLLWNSFPTANGEAADVVLGQPDFTTAVIGVTASTMIQPTAVSSNETQIAVADASNNRVLVWNSFPTANGAPADVVLGQAAFTSSTAATTATTMAHPSGVLFHEDMLIVSDTYNSRSLVFRPLPCLRGSGATAAILDPGTGTCYAAFAGPLSWADAEAACNGLGGHLAHIADASANEIARAVPGVYSPFIGLNDQAVEGTFVWSSGDAVTYTNWSSGEPNDWGGVEDCAQLQSGTGMWNDMPCTTALPYLCTVP